MNVDYFGNYKVRGYKYRFITDDDPISKYYRYSNTYRFILCNFCDYKGFGPHIGPFGSLI